MKKETLLTGLLWLLAITATGVQADTRYEIRADGLACPYCAYGVEKKFSQIEGVKDFDIDLQKGVVKVTVKDGVELTESQLQQLFKDAGFSYRSVKKITQ